MLAACANVDSIGLLQRTRTEMLILDFGYAGGEAMTPAEHRATVPIPQREVVRLEALGERQVETAPTVDEWLAATIAGLEAAIRAGAVGAKTIAAYRGGLRIERHDRASVESDFAALRRRAAAGEPVRLEGAPLCHTLLLEAAGACARLGVPLQVHCGLGDPDEDLAVCSPLGLRPLFVDERFRGLDVVLLHCYPFHREAAYLANVFPGVHMDLSLAIHLAAEDGARAVAESLGLCPVSKLLYATDATRYAEVYLVAAELSREALARALGGLVEHAWLTRGEAVDAGREVLAGNATRLYRLG